MSKIRAGQISSGSATDGQVLTADGAGVATWEDPAGGSGGGGAALTVEEIDGTPSVGSVAKILVTNGTLTDNGSGEVQLDFGSAATDGAAIHDDVAGEIHAITAKATPVDADEIVIEDSADTWNKKRVALSDLPGGAGGAPTDADYVVETANGSLSAESVLGTTVITTAAYASRQAAAKAGRIFLPNDGLFVERDTGAAWAAWGPIFPLTPPVSGDFAWVNQGTATLTTTPGGLIIYAAPGGGENMRIQKQAAPGSTPYTVTACFLAGLVTVNYTSVGLCWRQSSDGKIVTFATGRTGALDLAKMNSATSWNATYLTLERPFSGGPIWYRLVDDGTNRLAYVSENGQVWRLVHSVGRTDFLTADEVGFFANTNNNAHPVSITLLSWKVT